jgi:hypothetical protein
MNSQALQKRERKIWSILKANLSDNNIEYIKELININVNPAIKDTRASYGLLSENKRKFIVKWFQDVIENCSIDDDQESELREIIGSLESLEVEG